LAAAWERRKLATIHVERLADMRIHHLFIAALVLGISLSSLAASHKKKSDSDSSATSKPSGEAAWHKLKTAKADAKTKATFVKFQPTTDKFRVTIVAKSNTDGVASRLRTALMVETLRDQDNVPRNWEQVKPISEGEPKNVDPIEFTGGLDKNGKPKWYAISVSGQKAHYEILIEDQGTRKSKDSQE
jgi:hypothetical protein